MTSEFRLLLKNLRQEQELSQDELARSLGISRQSIISLEQGEYMPSFPLLLGMIEFFNCDLDQLVEGAPLDSATTLRVNSTRGKPQMQKVNQETNEKGGEQQMQIARFDPFQAIDKMHDEMSSMVDKTFGRVDWPRAIGGVIGAMNIHESEKEYTLEVQVPGFKESEINLELTEDTLTISGEKKAGQNEALRPFDKTQSRSEELEERPAHGEQAQKTLIRREWEQASFSRSVRFSNPIVEEKIEAKLSEGTLTIHAPKVEQTKPKVTKIEVKKK